MATTKLIPKFDLTGRRFGRWIVTGCDKTSGRRRWECRCDCGGAGLVRPDHLKSGESRSCGCLQRERLRSGHQNRRHGESSVNGQVTWSPEYRTWTNLKQRCDNPSNSAYKYYGGRGIKVCERWLKSYENFLVDMGRKPSPKHSIDRIDNDGDYEPGNCRWATQSEQLANRRRGVKDILGS